MSDFDVSSVLSQIRSLQSQAAGFTKTPAASGLEGAAASTGGGFGSVLKTALDHVSLSQNAASTLQTKFELGDANTDLASVMVASSRAQVEFKGLVEVRNRMVRAYQDIMNMPL